jgi:hypothetical protein
LEKNINDNPIINKTIKETKNGTDILSFCSIDNSEVKFIKNEIRIAKPILEY